MESVSADLAYRLGAACLILGIDQKRYFVVILDAVSKSRCDVTKAWLGIDTGGTFTDLVLVNVESGEQWLFKTPTTPDDASRGILEGMRAILDLAGLAPTDVDL